MPRFRRGWALLISTPSGRSWFYDLFTRGKDAEERDYASFHFPINSNPYFPVEEWEEARRTLPADVFRQEYLAEFIEDSAGVFRNNDSLFSLSRQARGKTETAKPNNTAPLRVLWRRGRRKKTRRPLPRGRRAFVVEEKRRRLHAPAPQRQHHQSRYAQQRHRRGLGDDRHATESQLGAAMIIAQVPREILRIFPVHFQLQIQPGIYVAAVTEDRVTRIADVVGEEVPRIFLTTRAIPVETETQFDFG